MTPAIYQPRNIAFHRVDESGDAILHDSASGEMVVLNAVGAAAYVLVDGERSCEEIAAEIADVFGDVERDQVLNDVLGFLADLAARGLIIPKSP